jgi:hypothetical protein
MSIDISRKNAARLEATARAEGISVDTYIERLMNEREEFAAIIERSAARMPLVSQEGLRSHIEEGFRQSENGEVVDGEDFCNGLLSELDDLERKRRAG